MWFGVVLGVAKITSHPIHFFIPTCLFFQMPPAAISINRRQFNFNDALLTVFSGEELCLRIAARTQDFFKTKNIFVVTKYIFAIVICKNRYERAHDVPANKVGPLGLEPRTNGL